jgi:transcriptional regulator with XRE-family HTH domain
MTIGRRLRRARERRGLSVPELANVVGVPNHTIHDLEWDRATPDTAMLERLAAAFGVTPEELIAEIEASAPT